MNEQVFIALAAILGFAGYLYFQQQKQSKPTTSSNLLTNLNQLAKEGRLPAVIGLENEIERLCHILARKQKNNPLLLGNPGVGKTAVVEALAQRIVEKKLPESFHNKVVYSLNLADLFSGTRFRGELEGRLKAMLESLEKDSRTTILFIDEIHMLQQARGSEGALDIADIIKPALSRGDLHIIGATTWNEYQKYIKPDAALDRRFQPIIIDEPSRDQAIAILEQAKSSYEAFHQVSIHPEAIIAAVDGSIAFIKDRFLPDKAFDLIDEASAAVSMESLTATQSASMALIKQATSHVINTCDISNRVVTPEHIHTILEQWKTHQQTDSVT